MSAKAYEEPSALPLPLEAVLPLPLEAVIAKKDFTHDDQCKRGNTRKQEQALKDSLFPEPIIQQPPPAVSTAFGIHRH